MYCPFLYINALLCTVHQCVHVVYLFPFYCPFVNILSLYIELWMYFYCPCIVLVYRLSLCCLCTSLCLYCSWTVLSTLSSCPFLVSVFILSVLILSLCLYCPCVYIVHVFILSLCLYCPCVYIVRVFILSMCLYCLW